MQPSIGRIVHYRENLKADCQAAIVVHVWQPDYLNLAVIRARRSNDRQQPGLADLSVAWKTSIKSEETAVFGNPSWHWPERVDEEPTLDTRSDAP